MAAGPAQPVLPPAGEAGAGPPLSPAAPASKQDPRVRCCSRHGLGEVMALCAPFVRGLAEGQPGAADAAGDAFWSFETAVRENVTINGEPWEETWGDSESRSGSNMRILEDQCDDLIVETATKRKQWPKKILVHAIQAMKAEQEMLVTDAKSEDSVRPKKDKRALFVKKSALTYAKVITKKLYHPVITPEEIRSQPSQDAYIANLKQVTEMASKQISGAMKSLPVLIERAEGFSQALTWQPTLELCKLRQEVFAGCKAKEEDNVQNFISPGEVTPTDNDNSRKSCVLLKRKKTVDLSERRRYPLRRRRITLSA